MGRSSAVAANDGCSRRDRGDVAPVGDARHEGLKSRHSLQRVGFIDVVLDHHMDEGHAVLETEDLVGEALRFALVQIGEHRLDQLLVLVGSLGLDLLPHHGRLHRVLHFMRPWRPAPNN